MKPEKYIGGYTMQADIDRLIYESISPTWNKAYALGEAAQKEGKPRVCDLGERCFVTPSGTILKVYKSAWEQGYDGWKIPAIFTEMEKALDKLPLRRYNEAE
jgi:hypothetical protein